MISEANLPASRQELRRGIGDSGAARYPTRQSTKPTLTGHGE
jgi:hypothetical protein